MEATVNNINFETEDHALRNFELNFLLGKRCKNFQTEKKDGLYVIEYDDGEAKSHVEKTFCFSGGEFGYGYSKTTYTPLETLSDKAEELYQKLLEGAIC